MEYIYDMQISKPKLVVPRAGKRSEIQHYYKTILCLTEKCEYL